MHDAKYWIVPLIIGFIIYYFMSQAAVEPGKALRAKFINLGNIVGRSKAEIIAAIGPATAFSTQGAGSLLQWMETGYHICLIFDSNDICQGITHEVDITGSSPPTRAPSAEDIAAVKIAKADAEKQLLLQRAQLMAAHRARENTEIDKAISERKNNP